MSNPFTGEVAEKYDGFFETAFGRKVKEIEGEILVVSLKGFESAEILEVGCGTGVWIEFLRERGFKEPVGLDVSRDMLRVAKRKGLRKLVEGRAAGLPFKDSQFDGVMFITSLEFMVDRKRALLEAARVARRFILVGFLNAYSPMALFRKVKGFFKESVYSKGQFLTREEVEKAARWVGQVSPYSLKVESFKTSLNFSVDGFVNERLERLVGWSSPFGAFGVIRFRVVKRDGARKRDRV